MTDPTIDRNPNIPEEGIEPTFVEPHESPHYYEMMAHLRGGSLTDAIRFVNSAERRKKTGIDETPEESSDDDLIYSLS
jgi:hypothetical protein